MYTDIKYVNLLSSRLTNFKRKDDFLWNFRCPLCGDSQKNRNKTRGFIFKIKTDLVYKCHNCGISMPFPKLIEALDPTLYKEYRLEKFKESNKPRKPTTNIKKVVSGGPEFKRDVFESLPLIQNLNITHPARQYLEGRKIPLNDLYWAENFKEWSNLQKPGSFDDTSIDEGRIIIPLRTKGGTALGYQGRSLGKSGLRYITILFKEDSQKIFGLDKLDHDKRIYITEGPFDSLFLDNAVAMAGADVSRCSTVLGSDLVYVYDNEPRNEHITRRIESKIKDGQMVVIWPTSIKEKDINDMVMAGLDVQNIVKLHTYSGLTATLKFNDWKQ